jgi:hypothetical protein
MTGPSNQYPIGINTNEETRLGFLLFGNTNISSHVNKTATGSVIDTSISHIIFHKAKDGRNENGKR